MFLSVAFVRKYRKDQLFTNLPGWEHAYFPCFKWEVKVVEPERLKKRQLSYSKKLDRSKLAALESLCTQPRVTAN